jgi:hypothetical protein
VDAPSVSRTPISNRRNETSNAASAATRGREEQRATAEGTEQNRAEARILEVA